MNHRGTILVLLGILAGCWFNLGGVPLFDQDEGAFGEATREMVASGNYLATTVNGQPFYDKPILTFWLQAAAVHAFGPREAAVRLPSAIASTLWIVALYLFVRRRYGERTGAAAAFMLATGAQIPIIAKAAIADALLNLFLALTMGSIWLHLESGRRRYARAAAACMALGFLTKGPIAIAIPLGASLAFVLCKKRVGAWTRALADPVAIGLFVAIAAPWYVAEYRVLGPGFVRAFVLKHNIGRLAHPMEGHRGSLFYYIPVVLLGLLPYTVLLLRAAVRVRRWIGDDSLLFGAIWFALVFVFFSVSGTKLPHYVIYGYTPLFLLMALEIPNARSDAILFSPALLLFVAFLFLPEIATLAAPAVKDPFARLLMRESPQEFGHVYRIFFALACAVSIAFMTVRSWDRTVKLAAIGLIATVGLNGFVMPAYARLAQEPIRQAAGLAKERGLDVIIWGVDAPSFLFYSQRLARSGAPGPGDICLMRSTRLERLATPPDILFERHGIVLARLP